ncbi:tyrosine-protein phosphatase non-receptor type 9 isoform X2 [Parasteatoda tepidariorum]|uniref:tyrosine-protein phosphatase non-receptor type 9 isoform X2 n=1 Tax=Parasteatoda tepidariorum TaxID=114398 RepID=UPI001C722990|nr:tyrosine-protein phosphatase non-receptor type 9 [Parasteatoda tepidariorum]
MEDILTEAEETAVKEFIAIIKELHLHSNGDKKTWNKSTAIKFMMARKFDICRAVALFESHEVMRRREGLIRFDPTSDTLRSELETGKFTILPVRDNSGAAIAIFTASKHVPMETSHQITLQGVIYQLDCALESIETQRRGIVFIYNMTGSRYANFDYELSQKILNLLKGGYPARLKKVLIVAAPLWFKAPFRIFQLFLREKLRDRVFMISVPQLCLHVPIASLPLDLGGSFHVDHKLWLQHCLKSTLNRKSEETSNTPLSPSPILNGTSFNGNITDLSAFQLQTFNDLEMDIDETSSDHQNSIHEKHNSEEREKEVEYLKENLLQDAIKDSDEPCPLTPESVVTDFTEEDDNEKHLSSSSASLSIWEDSAQSDTGGGRTLEEFIEYLRTKGRKGLYHEYAEFKAAPPDGTFETSKLKANQPKNRYTDVLCYDHSRVKLPIMDDDPNSDYINANFVDGYKQKNAFISCQGPLPKTFADYWRMIWDQESHVIVMTTKTIERGKVKCGQYWPAEENSLQEYGEFVVFNKKVENFTDYIVTSLELTNRKQNTSQEVAHMQFTSWPDYGVPPSALAMLDFRDKVRMKQDEAVRLIGVHWQGHPLGPPIVVHCSAGIGRTGTFITLDISINRLEATGYIDIVKTVEKIRSQRAYSIQMPDQYVFCHLALLEYALCRGLLEDVDLSGFNDDDSESE